MGKYKNFMHANAALHLKCNLIPKQEKLIKSIKGYKVSINYLQEAMLNETNETHVKYLDYMIAEVSEKIQSLKDDLCDVIADIKLYKQYSKAAQRNYDMYQWPKVGDIVNAPGNDGKTITAKVYDVNSLSRVNAFDKVHIGYEYEVVGKKGFFKKKPVSKTYYGSMSLKTYMELN